MITREATIADWSKLETFFKIIYRNNHPLHSQVFWEWQYGDAKFGRSFISLNENEEIVGHVGANFQGGIAWIINVYLTEECRGKGILSRLYALARNYFPLGATAANEAGLGLYRNMRWIRYHDLVRYVKINPNCNDKSFDAVCSKIEIKLTPKYKIDNNELKHYFNQPSLKGIVLRDESAAVSQEIVGGLRIISFQNCKELEDQAWEIGYNWIDYITSWNDLQIKDLEKNNWVLDYKSVVPWRLNPVEENKFCDITFLSEEPLDKDFIVKRYFSDHGRIGSL
ncbi:MAG: GNAT family N-acetyltransferase [Flavobacterium sp.]|nr:GNAT family N-acetyltransferase [Flavobacterium sp.]